MLIDGCEIIDWPTFFMAWLYGGCRQNYMSMKLVKEQIDIMAAYKLNIFHFHITEDIAWRLHRQTHPQLTDAKYMLP